MQDTGHTVMRELRSQAGNGEAAHRLARAGNRYQPWAIGAKEGGSVISSNSYGKLTQEQSCPVRRGDTDTTKDAVHGGCPGSARVYTPRTPTWTPTA